MCNELDARKRFVRGILKVRISLTSINTYLAIRTLPFIEEITLGGGDA